MTHIDFIGLMEQQGEGKELFRKYCYARALWVSALNNMPDYTFSKALENEAIANIKDAFLACADELKKLAHTYGLSSIEFTNLTAYLERE